MKDMKTNLAGRIRNMPHFRSEALLPLFEAVINSIQAIAEKGDLSRGSVTVRIIRDKQQSLDNGDTPPITGFDITDNGIGFNDANFDSFQTADSPYKESLGGKGVGRFLWLKAFARVDIDSVYAEKQKRMRRKFGFSAKSGIGEGFPETTDAPFATTVHLIGFKKDYQRLPTAYKTTGKIAQRILEHCLSYFISGAVPRITLEDDDGSILLNTVYDNEYKSNIQHDELTLRGSVFSLTHLKLYSTYEQMHNIVLCADKRDVTRISLSKALGTSTQFDDDNRRFTYALYATSPYLDKHADHYRLSFDLPEDEALLGEASGVSMRQITDAMANSAKAFLSEYLKKTMAKKHDIVTRYVSHENPALRAVPVYCPEVFDEIEPNSTDERIDEVLYHFKGKTEYQIRKRSAELLKTQTHSLQEIDAAYAQLVPQITDFQKDNLVKYLCDRKHIIAVLQRKLELNADGKYPNEDIVHDIIFPRKTDSSCLRFEDHNLWLIDEILAFHIFAASDIPFEDSMDSESPDRPDIVAFAELDEDKYARAVSLLEFKKPQRTSFDEDPTKQLYRYLREIKTAQKVKMRNGRDLLVRPDTRYFCYAICDPTAAIREFAENMNYAPLVGERGYYTYNRNHNAHFEILAFDKLVTDAKRRHKAFFDALRI
jgi:hypothetical protein